MTESPNVLLRKTTGERASLAGRRASDMQASPFRYIWVHTAGSRVKAEEIIQAYNHNCSNARSLALRSTWITISYPIWGLLKSGSQVCNKPMEWSI